MLLDWRGKWQRTLESPAALSVRNIGTLPRGLTDNPRLGRLKARQFGDDAGVLTKLEHCKENVSVMFHVVRTPPRQYGFR